MNLGLRGRVAIVAASSRGLGKAAAQALVEEGANVVVCAREKKNVIAAAKEIGRLTSKKQRVVPVIADVSKARDIQRIVRTTLRAFKRIDILVTNAGGPPSGSFDTLDDTKWEAGFSLTLMSTIRFMRAVLPHMKKQHWGRIINITSLTVKQPVNDLIISSTLRPGIIGLSKIMANLHGKDGITVNSVAPGYILTDRQKELGRIRANSKGLDMQDYIASVAKDVPLGRFGEPAELASVIAFLASEQASYVTGTTISVDGGLVRGLF